MGEGGSRAGATEHEELATTGTEYIHCSATASDTAPLRKTDRGVRVIEKPALRRMGSLIVRKKEQILLYERVI